ncbi:early nodulin-like protein 9 [Apium graveolens]|uniref:early nodulin-like protein 9 n=1 Tax=Apium graveolens TaxID=4045 RepID=UPI003D7A90E7
MAIPTLGSYTSKASYVFGLLSLLLLIQNGCAYEFIVGGASGWSPSGSYAFNQWAESKRFQIQDTLVFNYAADQDSVLYVTKDDYTNCNTENPIKKFTDGHTVYKFTQSGPHYFISGNEEHCHKNEKLVVVVLADRSNKKGNSPPPAESNPSPPPTSDASPDTPSDNHSHKNGAAGLSSVISFLSSVGALLGSSLMLFV